MNYCLEKEKKEKENTKHNNTFGNPETIRTCIRQNSASARIKFVLKYKSVPVNSNLDRYSYLTFSFSFKK